MEFRRVLAFILTTAMLLGNTVPAYATGVDGNGVTVVDEGDIKTTDVGEDGEEEEEGDVAGQNENGGCLDESGAGNDDGAGDSGGGNNQGSSDSGDNGGDSAQGGPGGDFKGGDSNGDGSNIGDDEGDSNGDSSNIGDGEGNPGDKNEGDDSAQNGAIGENNEGESNGDSSNNGTDNGDSNGEGSDEDDSDKSEGNDNGDENSDGDGTDSGVDGEDPADGDEKNPENGEDGVESGDSENSGEDEENLDGEEEPEDGEGLEGEEESEELEEEEEEEEDSLSDNSVSENDISVSVNELPMKTTGNGTVVLYDTSGESAVEVDSYSSIGDAVTAINGFIASKEAKAQYEIILSALSDDQTYEVSGTDLKLNSDAIFCVIKMNGQNITVTDDVECNINLVTGNVAFAKSDLTFRVLEKTVENQTSLNNISFIGADKKGKLVIGDNKEDGNEEQVAAFTCLNGVSFEGISDISIYDSVDIDSDINVNSLTVDLDYYSPDGTDVTREFVCLSNTTVNVLDITGNVSWFENSAQSVVVKESTRMKTRGGYEEISLYGSNSFHNLTVKGNHPLNLKYNFYCDSDDNVKSVLEDRVRLQLTGSVTMDEDDNKINLICNGTQALAEGEDNSIEVFPISAVVATVEGEISADLFRADDVNIVRNQNNKLVVVEKNEIFRALYYDYQINNWVEEGRYEDFSTMLGKLKEDSTRSYKVQLLKDHELKDGEHWNFSNTETPLFVELQLFDDTQGDGNRIHTLSVAEGAKATVTVDSISGMGEGVIQIKNNAALTLKGDVNGDKTTIGVYSIIVQANGQKGTLILGNPNAAESVSIGTIWFDGCNNLDVEMYGNVNWNTMLRASVSGNQLAGNSEENYITPEECAATFRSLKVVNANPNGAFIGNVLNVTTLDLDGNLNCDTLTAQTTKLTAGSFLCTTDVMTLNDITLRRGNGEEKAVILATQDIYKVGKKVHSGSIFLTGTLSREDGAEEVGFSFDKNGLNVVSAKNQPKYNIVSPYTAGAKINSGDVLATIGMNASEALRSHQNYSVNRSGMLTSVHNANGTYRVKAVDATKGIFVYEKKSGQSASFTDWTAVEDYISSNFGNDANAKVEITINANYTITDSTVLDYSAVKAKVTLNLNGYEVKLMNNQNVAVDEINGYNPSNVKGKLTLNKVNSIVPKGEQLVLVGVQLKPNSTTLTIGKENSTVTLLEAGSTSLTKLTVCGYVQWSGTISAPNMDLTAGNLRATGITVSTKLTTQTGNTIAVEPAGKLSLKNIEVQPGNAESFYIELERDVILGAKDAGKESDPDFVDALQVENRGIGTVTISGTITNSAEVTYPITFKKMNCWTYEVEEEGKKETIWQSKADNFANQEKLATVSTAAANNFMVLSFQKDQNGFIKDNKEAYILDSNVCTRKEGIALQAAYRVLTVSLKDTQMVNHYASLEDAVANIPKEFVDDKKKAINGTYVFSFLDDTRMNKAQTLPSCVKEAIFTTVGDEEKGYQEQTLDIQTFNLTTAGSIVMQGGLRIEGKVEAKTAPKLSVAKDLTIIVDNVTVTGDKKEYVPVENIAVDVSKGTLNLNAKAQMMLGNLKGTITAKNIKAEGAGTLSMNSLTVKSGEASFRNTKTYVPSVTMEKSKLYLGEGAKAELGTVVVKSAYTMESMGDCTIETAAATDEEKVVHLYIEDLTLPAGTFMAGKNSVVNVDKVTKVKDMILQEGAKFTTNKLTQVSGAKNYLEKDSILFINEKGNLETIIIGGKEGKEGDIYLGVGCKNVITTQGNETVLTINKVPTRNTEALMLKFFVGKENAVPAEKEGIIELSENQTIFSVAKAVKTFPLDLVEVIQPGDDSEECNIYQSATDIKIVGQYITLSALQPDGNKTVKEDYTELRRFTSWTDTMDYLTSHGNTATTYKVEINKDSVVVGGKMVLPKTVGRLIIEGVAKKKVTENVEDKQIEKEVSIPTYIDFTGDVSLTTNTEFINVSFTKDTDVATGVHGMAAAGKELVLDGVTSTFKSLTGTKTAKVTIKNSTITVPNKIQGIGTMELDNSTLYVKGNKAFTVTEVTMENSGLWLDGKTTITNLVTEGMGNRIATRDLVINGTVTSSDSSEMKAGTVTRVVDNEQVVTHYILGTDIQGDFSVKKNAIFLTKLDALGEKTNPVAGTTLVTAAKVPASWFVLNRNKIEANSFEEVYKTKVSAEEATPEVWEYEAFDLTYKVGNKIYSGAMPAKKVVLAIEESNIQLDSFDTLQEALNEISAIGDAKGKYIITLYGDDDSTTADYKFTEKKAESIKICAADSVKNAEGEGIKKVTLSYKKDLDLKTNVTFEDVILNPAADGNLKLNKYAVTLKNTLFNEGRKITVADSNAAAKLTLDNTVEQNQQVQQQSNSPEEMEFAAIKQSGTLELKNTNVNVAGELKTGTLDITDSNVNVIGKATLTKWVVNSKNSVFHGEGTITIKDIYLKENAAIETVALPTWGKTGADAGKITALKTQLTISGKLETESDKEELEFRVLCKKQDNSAFMEALAVTVGEGNAQVTTTSIMNAMAAVMTDTAKGNGIVLAKAPNISTSDVAVEKNAYNNTIIKKNGELFCKNTESYVTLEYEAGKDSNGNPLVVDSSFETFADAVKEIDTLKIKRDYKITFDGNGSKDGTEFAQGPIPAQAVMILTMPKATNVKTLTLEGNVYYTGAITFTSDVVLNDVNFVQVVNIQTDKKQPAEYRPVDEITVSEPYVENGVSKVREITVPAPVKVNNGGYKLTVANGALAKFNTPIELTGNKKGTLDLTGGKIFAGANFDSYGDDYELLEMSASEPDGSLIQGSVKAFATVRVGTMDVQIIGYPAYNVKTATAEYKSTALETTTLNIDGSTEVLVGFNSGNKESAIERKDNATIKDLNIFDGKLKVMGDGTFTNVAMSGKGPKLEVLGQKFNINGNLTNTANTVVEQGKEVNAEITATYDKTYASVLVVKGDVVLENAVTNRIAIRIADPAGKEIVLDTAVPGVENAKYSSRLLTAAKAKVKDFKPSQDSLPGESTEYGENNKNGYLIKKNGNFIEVILHGAEAAACALFLEDGTLVNYYPTANDAVKEIDSRKDKTKEYKIELYEDHGKVENDYNEEGEPVTIITYAELKMPKEAKKVVFVGSDEKDQQGNDVTETIYFNKDISLGCNTEFKNLEFESAISKDGKLTSSIKAGKFELTFEKCKTNIKDISSTGVVNLKAVTEIIDDTTIKTGTEITVEGKATLQNIALFGDEGAHNKIIYKVDNAKNITIKGDIVRNEQAEPLYLDIQGVVAIPTTENNKLTAAKVANIEKAYFDSFDVYDDTVMETQEEQGQEGQNPTQEEKGLLVAWDSKALYRIKEDYTNKVKVSDDPSGNKYVICLDLTEAAEYVKNVGNLDKEFTITLTGEVTDTNVTDSNNPSKVTLPDKDKAKAVVLKGEGNIIRFTDNIKTNGSVTIENVKLRNDIKDFEITNNKNSKGNNPAELILDRVNYLGKNISNIKGTAKVTKLTILGTQDSVSETIVNGAITNVAEMKLSYAKIIATTNVKAKSNVNKFIIEKQGAWETYGVTTIGDVELRNLATGTEGINTYIATYRADATSKPNLTVNGKVTGSAVVVKLYDNSKPGYLSETEVEGKNEYQEQKLLIAKTESAEKFIAAGFAKRNNGNDGYEFIRGVQSYKDNSNLVMNGDITKMDVVLTDNKKQLKTYVSTYADAITIINNINDKTADYTITLQGHDTNRLDGSDTHIIATNGKNGVSSLGKFVLPSANKAASLTIQGQEGKTIEIRYTGNITPQCALTFKNVHLSEGTVKNVKEDGVTQQIFTNSGLITLNLGNIAVTMDEKVTAGYLTQEDRDGMTPDYYDGSTITCKSISGSKGTLVLNPTFEMDGETKNIVGHKVYVQGATTVPYLQLESKDENILMHSLYTCGKVTLTDIRGEGKLDIGTYHGTDVWKKGKTQVQIKGEADPMISMNITPYIMTDKKLKTYAPITNVDGMDLTKEILITSSNKPLAYQQIVVAPKLASSKTGEAKITLAGRLYIGNNIQLGEEVMAVKYGGGLYFTLEQYSIRVQSSNGRYVGEFFTWDQAIKEIDKLDQKNWIYSIIVLKDLGTDKPLTSIPMPSKASDIVIRAVDNDHGIITTAKSISLKCPAGFENVCINGVQQKGGKYYAKEISLNIGNYRFNASSLLLQHEYQGIGKYQSFLKITGGKNGRMNLNTNEKEQKSITAISGIGEVNIITLLPGGRQTYFIPGGITGVGKITIAAPIDIDCGTKEFSVRDLDLAFTSKTCIKAKNIKVTGLSKLTNTTLIAGTTAMGDGKIVLGDVRASRVITFDDEIKDYVPLPYENYLLGKLDKTGRSQIEIKGVVTSDAENQMEPIVTVGLRLNNSSTKYVQLSEGLKLLKAQKASTSFFKPLYGNDKMGPELNENGYSYSIYKIGNDIVYGKVKSEDVGIPEARVWIGTSGTGKNTRYMDYMTLEEALKAIDTMAIQHTRTEGKKQVKYYESYTIELLKDVEIGNEKQNGSYKAISMPSKATDLTIWGGDDGHSITFTGNITLKCNTQLANVVLNPVKKVKNEVVPSKANVAVGNFALTINQAKCGEIVYDENGTAIGVINGVGNTSGSSKSGKLVLMPGNTWEANNITGLYGIEFVKNGNDSRASSITATGNLSVKDIIYGSNGKVNVDGNITTNTIHVNGDYDAEIYHDADKTMKINGTTITNPDKTKTTDAVFFEGAGVNTDVKVYLESATGKDIPEGAQIISGKYLEAGDWKFDINGVTKKAYLRNNNLYVGSAVAN